MCMYLHIFKKTHGGISLNDFLSDSPEILKHFISRLSINDKLIIICDNKLKIIEITPTASKLLNIKKDQNISDLLSEHILTSAKNTFKTTTPSTFTDNIDGIYYDIDISLTSNNLMFIFKDINNSVDAKISTLVMLTNHKITDFLTINKSVLASISKELGESKCKELGLLNLRQEQIALQSFSSKMSVLHHKSDFHVTSVFNLSEHVEYIINLCKDMFPNCNIRKLKGNPVFCAYNHSEFTSLLFNLIENVFLHCGISTKIEISVYEKHDRIHLIVKDNGKGIPDDILANVFNIKYSNVEFEMLDLKFGLPFVKKVISSHFGEIFIECSRGAKVTMVFPKFINDLLKSQTNYNLNNEIDEKFEYLKFVIENNKMP